MKRVLLWIGASQLGMAIVRRIGASMKIVVGDVRLKRCQRTRPGGLRYRGNTCRYIVEKVDRAHYRLCPNRRIDIYARRYGKCIAHRGIV